QQAGDAQGRAERQPKMSPEDGLDGGGKRYHHQGSDQRPPLPVLPVQPKIPVSHGQRDVKMKRANEQEQGQHQDKKIIGSGEPRFLTAVGLRRDFEIGARHSSLLTVARSPRYSALRLQIMAS